MKPRRWRRKPPEPLPRRTARDVFMSADAHRFLTAIENEAAIEAARRAGVPAAPDNRPGINLAAHDTCELIHDMPPATSRNTERGNR